MILYIYLFCRAFLPWEAVWSICARKAWQRAAVRPRGQVETWFIQTRSGCLVLLCPETVLPEEARSVLLALLLAGRRGLELRSQRC